MDTIWSLLKKHRETLLYLVFGVLTTLVNILTYSAFRGILPDSDKYILLANAIAWLLSVLFAYLTNRTWVFQSQARGAKAILGEILAFTAARLFSGGVDMAIMYIGPVLLALNDMVVKVASNILVIVLNYFLSKFLVFKKNQ